MVWKSNFEVPRVPETFWEKLKISGTVCDMGLNYKLREFVKNYRLNFGLDDRN